MKKVPVLYLSIFLIGLVVDQVVKAWARGRFAIGESLALPWPGVFELTLTYNKGIAFGMFQGAGVLFVPVALGMAGDATWMCWRSPQQTGLAIWGLGMLAGGAIGNLIDRVWLGKVTDMFWLRAINFPVFNIADALITVGAILIGVHMVFEAKPEATPQEKPITNT